MTLFSVMITRIVCAGPLMFFTVLVSFLLTSFIPVCYTSSTEETSNRYECGPHGKFEYCIDGIPGCVIGCHCYPGYYFDTDTKICEPNTKLAQDFRRRYMAEPTPTESIPTPTTTSVLTERTDEITKDTDDIGDWLFNQFFKTIETQVINNTDDEQTPTRRANVDVYRPVSVPKHGGQKRAEPHQRESEKPKTKTRKSWRSRGKKKKSKVHGLRRKLLRITEDDSLFDSESDEDNSGGDSSNSDSSSSGSSDRSSSAASKERKNEGDNKNDREHGHKKVIIFNKRPRPPLPSFIFLPSMDTPYYPPIGLPPPPVLPMFPMVPVPPMAPVFPFLDSQNGSSTTAAAGKDGAAPDAETTTAATEAATTEETAAVVNLDPGDAVKHSDRRTRPKAHRPRIQLPIPSKMSDEETFLIRARDTPPRIPSASKQAERMKLVHKLRQRLKKKNKLPPIQDNTVVYPDEDGPLIDETRKQTKTRPFINKDQELNDVNFKYITELIHRVNRSDTDLPPAPDHIKTDSKHSKKSHHSRRNYDSQISKMLLDIEPTTHSNPHIQKAEDAYFSNLGRQIASLVRNVETKLDNNIVNEPSNQQETESPISQDNSNTPHGFWERSIRSPLTRFKNYFDKLRFDKQSGEKNLFSLENEVKTLATTMAPLTLQDLENILSTLQKAQAEMKKSKQSTDQSNRSLNVNLLPNKSEKSENSYKKFNNPLDYAEYFPRTKHLATTTNISQDFSGGTNATHYLDPTNLDSPMIDDWMFDTQDYNKQMMNQMNDQQIINQQATLNKTLEHEVAKYNSKPLPVFKKINKQNDYLRFHKTPQFVTQNTAMNTELSAKYHEIPINHPELQPKYPEQLIKYAEQPVKHPEQPLKYSEWLAKIAEMSAKYPELLSKYRELIGQYHDLPAKYPEPIAKSPELLPKYPTLPQKLPEVPMKRSMQSPKNQANPTVVNYKSLDYFSDTNNKRHYTFEASYPLHIPNYRRRFSKRFESGPGKQSYFHHELHHFDYID